MEKYAQWFKEHYANVLLWHFPCINLLTHQIENNKWRCNELQSTNKLIGYILKVLWNNSIIPFSICQNGGRMEEKKPEF